MIYFIRRENGDIKIGTTKTYKNRLAQLKAEYGELTLLGAMDGSFAMERRLHEQFSHLRINRRSEWFRAAHELLTLAQSKDRQEEFASLNPVTEVERPAPVWPDPQPGDPIGHPNQGILVERANGDKAVLRTLIVDAINESGSIHAAAKSLGVQHNTLNYWRKKLDIKVYLRAE